jgi:hypothetical protein
MRKILNFLSDIPLDNTIRVRVDAIEWLIDWTYNTAQNAIVFDTNNIPLAGSDIEAEYGVYGDCN